MVTAKALGVGYVPWVYHFADMVNSNSSPWINMLQRAIFDGDVDGAITEAQAEDERDRRRMTASSARNEPSAWRWDQWQGWLFMAPALLFVAVFVLVPLGQLVATSLTDRSLLGGGRFIGFENYFRIWRDSGFWRALKFTGEYTHRADADPDGARLRAGAARPCENTALKRATRTIVFLPVVIGLSSSSLLWFWLLDEQVGLFNKLLVDLHVLNEPIVWFVTADLAFWAVIISITWKVVGFGMVLFVSGIQAINPDILEAAVVDGAGYWSRVRLIILPLTRRDAAADDAGQRDRIDAGVRSVLHHDVGRRRAARLSPPSTRSTRTRSSRSSSAMARRCRWC